MLEGSDRVAGEPAKGSNGYDTLTVLSSSVDEGSLSEHQRED